MNTIKIKASVPFPEDAIVNGVEETGESPRMPFMVSDMEAPCVFSWNIEIDVETGVIVGWKEMFPGTTAKTYYKVCDCLYFEYDGIVYDDYVPRFLSIFDTGYGDYIYLEIDGEGRIKDWDVEKFKNEIEKIREEVK